QVESSTLLGPDRPWLRIDPTLGSSYEGLGATEERSARTIALGGRLQLTLDGAGFANDVDVANRGWRAGARLSLELGGIRLDVGTSVHHVDTRLARGTYQLSGLSLAR